MLKYLKEKIKNNDNLLYLILLFEYKIISIVPSKLHIYLKWKKNSFKSLDLNNPKTFNEKIQWLKLYYRDPLITKCSDKLLVRDFVKEKIGGEYLNDILKVYSSIDEIKWDKLPKSFVIKLTHDSGSAIISKNKEELDIQKILRKLNYCRKINYGLLSKEWGYKDIEPKIIVEKYLGEIKDYKVFCFSGKPMLIQVDIDRFTNHTRNIYDTNWNWIDLSILYPKNPLKIENRPECLDLLLHLSSKLSEPFPHVRVDWYIVNNKPIFGEMTFYHGSGFEPFDDVNWEIKMGDWISLPNKIERNKSNNRIIIIVPTLSGGGAENVAAKLSTILPGDITIIIFYNEVVYNYSGRIISLNESKTNNPFMKIVRFIKRSIKISKIKKKLKPNFSISFMEYSNIINILTKKKEIVISSVRETKSSKHADIYEKILIFMIRFFYNKADYIVSVSKGIVNDLTKLGVKYEKINVIYNPIDLDKIYHLSNEEISEFSIDWNKTIISSGRLVHQKGHWHLIRAFKEVKSQITDAKLLVLGEGELQSYLVELAYNYGLKVSTINQNIDNNFDILLLGFQKNPYKFIAKAELFVLPSLFEGLPNVLIEAMCFGIPILSADCRYGPREILAPDTDYEYETKDIEYAEFGVLLPVADGKYYTANDPLTREEEIWTDAIIDMLKDEQKRIHYSNKDKERVKDFSSEIIAKQWDVILSKKDEK